MKMLAKISIVLCCFCSASCSSEEDSPPDNSDNDNIEGDTAPKSTTFPKLAWPVDAELDNGVFLMNYFDNELGPGKSDHTCGIHTYDGHTGIDISAYSFREMDKGVVVKSATDGEVIFVDDGNYDRTYKTPYTNDPNMIQIKHSDGTSIWYAHLRTNSISVRVGDQVKKGQHIGMIGSSGATPFPHLHFELWEKGNNPRDPYAGLCNDYEGLWESPITYKGSDEVKVYDFDITNADVNPGTWQLESDLQLRKEEPVRPAVFGIQEDLLKVWLFYQGAFGSYSISIEMPDGSEFVSKNESIDQRSFAWDVHQFDFSEVSSDDQGIWKLNVAFRNQTKTIEFEVGDRTEYRPRFYPLNGESIKIDAQTSDTFTFMHHSGNELTYDLINAPTGTSISGNTITFGLTQSSRNHYFELVATDDFGRSDTMYYHLIDMSKPVE